MKNILLLAVLLPSIAFAQAAEPVSGTCHLTVSETSWTAKDGTTILPYVQIQVAVRNLVGDAQPFYTTPLMKIAPRISNAERNAILRDICVFALTWQREKARAQTLATNALGFTQSLTITNEQVP